MEWKSGGDVKGRGAVTELLTAPPATTPARGSSHTPATEVGAQVIEASIGRAGRVHPNGHASRGDGARGHRASPPPSEDGVASLLSRDTEDTVIWYPCEPDLNKTQEVRYDKYPIRGFPSLSYSGTLLAGPTALNSSRLALNQNSAALPPNCDTSSSPSGLSTRSSAASPTPPLWPSGPPSSS